MNNSRKKSEKIFFRLKEVLILRSAYRLAGFCEYDFGSYRAVVRRVEELVANLALVEISRLRGVPYAEKKMAKIATKSMTLFIVLWLKKARADLSRG